MHPIERLRYVARSSGAPQGALVRETAAALGSLGFDPAGLVTACRRVLDRHPASGPLWWLAARMLTAVDAPDDEGWRCAADLANDPTARELAHALPEAATVCVVGWPELAGEALSRRADLEVLAVDALDEAHGFVRMLLHAGVDAAEVPIAGLAAAVVDADLVLLECSAAGGGAFVAVSGSRAAAAVARHAGAPVWMVAGAGRRLPGVLFGALLERLDAARDGDTWDADDEVVPADLVDRVCGPVGPVEPHVALATADCPVAPELLRAVPPL
ncbi:MAG: hypothetical protein ACRD0G_19585 [Acidimicrobiales bacterium]